jgi:hypothetical protein
LFRIVQVIRFKSLVVDDEHNRIKL